MTAGEEFLRDVDAVLGAEPISVEDALAQIAAQPEEAIAILDRTDRPFTFVARETARTRLTAALAQAGVRAPSRVVDAWLGPVIRTSGEARGSGGLIEFAPAEPCSEEVDGADVLIRVAAFARRYLVADEPVYDALALWIALTYFVDVVRVAPILAIVSAIWRSGKTKALEIVALTASRVLSASNVTPSVIFRVVDKFAPTLVVDELDSFLEANQELRGILNSGHTRAMAYVIRGVGDDYEPRRFSTWGAKAVALIGKLPPTLTDRSVVVQMRRRKKDEPVQVLDTSDADIVEEAAAVRSQLARFAEDHPFLPSLPRIEFLDDRAADNWEPLAQIAAIAGGDWPERARKAAQALTPAEDEEVGVLLLENLMALRAARDVDDIPTAEILPYLHGLEERPWSKWGKHRQPIDSHQLARLLRPFGVRPMSFGGRVRGYRFSDGLADAASRYVNSPVPRQTPVEPVIASFPQVRADVDPSYGFEGDDGSKVPVTSAYDAMTGQTGVSSGAPASEPDTGVGEEGSRDPEAVIEAIRVHGPQSVPALAKRLGWTWSEVSRVLRELEAEGRVWSYVDDDQGAEVYDLREVS